jgi:mannose-6-phosphate isomerase
VLEVQESSDITYRLHDYNRVGLEGKPREVHLEKALRSIHAPQRPNPRGPVKVIRGKGWEEQVFLDGEPFYVSRVVSNGAFKRTGTEVFLCVSVLSGNGRVLGDWGELPLSRGDHLMALKGTCFAVEGELEMVLSAPGKGDDRSSRSKRSFY